jgi:DNA-binding FadR family transcriptional regulator
MDTLSKTTLTEAVVEHFQNKIQSGELKPGDKLPSERILVNKLKISRFCLREGLARLSALGVIEIHQGKGAFVSETISEKTLKNIWLPVFNISDEKNFRELIEARVFLETALAKKAALVRKDKDIKKLKEILQKSKLDFDDPVMFAKLDSQFHQLIAVIADNMFMWKMQQLLHGAVEDFISENTKSDKTRIDAIKDHEQILKDIINKDVKNIGKTVPAHISICVEHFKNKMNKGSTE